MCRIRLDTRLLRFLQIGRIDAHPGESATTRALRARGLVHDRVSRRMLTGAQVAIEDYTHGMTRHVLIIGVTCISYAAIATGLFALARMAL